MTKDPMLANKYRRRDYTGEPIKVNEELERPFKKPPEKIKKRSRKKLITAILIFLIVVIAGWAFLLPHSNNTLKVDLKKIQKSANFDVYSPSHLPNGYVYQKNSATYSNGTVLYYVSSGKDNKINITIQSKPTNVDFNDFYTRLLGNKSDVISKYGKAVIGNGNNQIIGSLVTDKSWVLVNVSSKVDSQTVSKFLESLEPVR